MRATRLLIFAVLLAPFILSFSFFPSKKRDHEDMANEISAKVAKTLCKKHNMEWVGEGGGMMGSVYTIGLSFRVYHPLDRNEARMLVVDCVEELLAAVNQNEEIRPYLKDYPFTTKNVDIAVYSSNSDGRTVFDPYITVASIYKSDTIEFATKEPNQVPYKNEYRESYQAALTQVKGNHLAENPTP